MDCVPGKPYSLRPEGYHENAAEAISILIDVGIPVGVQTVLVKDNISLEIIDELYDWCIKKKVKEWSLLRFFPSGRGVQFAHCEPSRKEYIQAINYIENLKNLRSGLDIQLQYVLTRENNINCRAVSSSIGILPNGMCVSCFWGLVKNTKVVDESFILGNLVEQSINEILSRPKAIKWENNEKCLIFD